LSEIIERFQPLGASSDFTSKSVVYQAPSPLMSYSSCSKSWLIYTTA